MYKIFWKYGGNVEEIDEFETEKEAVAMMAEYRIAYGPAAGEMWVKKV